MRRRRLAATCAFLATAATALSLGAATFFAGNANAATPSAAINYVALGDSYSSGVGGGGTSTGGTCIRSSNGYPALWARSHNVTSFKNVTCAGAVTSGVINNQVNSLSASTTVVTISIGGNDANFAGTVLSCSYGTEAACKNTIEKGLNDTSLVTKLDNAYAAIKKHAPNAKVYVLGYPRLYEGSGSCASMSLAKRQDIRQGSDGLAAAIQSRAEAAGFTYVDVRDIFEGHLICSAQPWINGGSSGTGAYHPNASGYRNGYLAALNEATG